MTVFQQMIAELEVRRCTPHKIAQQINVRHGTSYRWNQIQRIKDGGRVVYPLDFYLAELHTQECGHSLLTIVPSTQAQEIPTA